MHCLVPEAQQLATRVEQHWVAVLCESRCYALALFQAQIGCIGKARLPMKLRQCHVADIDVHHC
jgi:hypothetical protein